MADRQKSSKLQLITDLPATLSRPSVIVAIINASVQALDMFKMTTKYTLHRDRTYHSADSGYALVMIIVGIVISGDFFVSLKE